MTDFHHNIVSILYSIKGLSESHLLRAKEGRFPIECDRALHAEEILKRVHGQSSRALEITRRLRELLNRAEHGSPPKACRADRSAPDVQAADRRLLNRCGDDNGNKKADLKSAWQETLAQLNQDCCLVRIQILERIPNNFQKLQVKPEDLKEILYHLAKNAIQAMQTDEIESSDSVFKLILRANLGFNRREEKVAMIQVSDTGPGIPETQLANIFLPFFTTKSSLEGNGLGLYLTQQLVRKSGGRISVQSFPGMGTTFSLELPLVDSKS